MIYFINVCGEENEIKMQDPSRRSAYVLYILLGDMADKHAADSSQKKSKKKISKKAIIITLIVLLVAAVALTVFFLLRFDAQDREGGVSVDPQKEAIKEQKKVVKQTENDEEKAQALIALASLYSSNSNVKQAMKTQEEAYRLNPNPDTASSIALNACEVKNQAVCQKYIELTVEGYKANPEGPNSYFLPYFERRLAAVKQGNLKDEPSFMQGLEP